MTKRPMRPKPANSAKRGALRMSGRAEANWVPQEHTLRAWSGGGVSLQAPCRSRLGHQPTQAQLRDLPLMPTLTFSSFAACARIAGASTRERLVAVAFATLLLARRAAIADDVCLMLKASKESKR